MPRAEMDPCEWFTSSRLKLEAADSFYGKKDYGNAISCLQGTEERTAKAILLCLSFLPDDPGLAKFLKNVVGAKYITPKALDHDWHVQFFEDLNPYIDTFEAIGTSFGIKKPGWRTTQYWRSKGPEFRWRIEAARSIKSNPSPKIEELTADLEACTKLLEETEENIAKMKTGKIKIPKARQVDPAAKASLKRAGIYVPREPRREIEEQLLERFRSGADRFAGNVREIIALVQVLVVVAVLNVYLNGHHELGEYPTSQIHYDDAFPMVVKFAEIRSLLNTCLNLAKVHSAAIVEAAIVE